MTGRLTGQHLYDTGSCFEDSLAPAKACAAGDRKLQQLRIQSIGAKGSTSELQRFIALWHLFRKIIPWPKTAEALKQS